jgi:hypothetical protein
MRIDSKKFSLIFCCIILFSFSTFANGHSLESVTNDFASTFSKVSKLASPSFSAMSVDSAGMLLVEVQKRVKGVYCILRINSSGTVINEIGPDNTAIPMRSVAEQKWFIDVKNKSNAYFGTARESGKTYPLLFFAWPIQTGSGAFGGVLAVKLDATQICSGICEDDSVHFAAFYNENLLYRCGNDRMSFVNESVYYLPDSSKITLRFGEPTTIIDMREPPEEQKSNVTEINQKKSEPVSLAEKKVINKPEEVQKLPQRKKGKLNISIFILLCIVIVSGFLLMKSLKNKSKIRDKNTNDKYEEAVETESQKIPEVLPQQEYLTDETIINRKENTVLSDVITHDDTEHLSAEETCDKIKALISEKTEPKKISLPPTSNVSTDEVLRKELYKEIHGEILHWVTSESTRLSQALQELSDRVGKLENVNDPEVTRIRNEAHRISKEIALFKDNPADLIQSLDD